MAREFDSRKLTLGLPRTLVSQILSALQPCAVSASGTLLYAAGPNASRFRWLSRVGQVLEALSETDRPYAFRLSPDGKRIIEVRLRGYGPPSELWQTDLVRHVFSLFVPASRDLLDTAVWSSDGQRVLFNRSRDVFRKGISDSGEGERIVPSPPKDGWIHRLCDWSRDGRFLLYETVSSETKRDLWVAPLTPDGRLAEGAQPTPYLRGPSAEWHGRFSPDSRWVAYESDETGRNEIYIASFPEARRRLQVTSGGGIFPQWGPDGRELFYLSGDGTLTVVSLQDRAGSLEPSSPQPLFPLTAPHYIASPYEVAPDGKRILVNQVEPNTQLDVVMNWPLLLRKQAAQ
jgi:hypothetical protein